VSVCRLRTHDLLVRTYCLPWAWYLLPALGVVLTAYLGRGTYCLPWAWYLLPTLGVARRIISASYAASAERSGAAPPG
jgi:hypothetical protein